VDDFRQLTGLDQLTGDDTVTLARTAAEAIRGLNRATNSAAGLNQPSTAYDIIGALSLAASRLPQLITQITRYLGQAASAGRLGHDFGEDPATAVEATVIFLDDARLSAAALSGDLDAAWQHLAPVSATPRPARTSQQDQP
jgi:hypothetical protein